MEFAVFGEMPRLLEGEPNGRIDQGCGIVVLAEHQTKHTPTRTKLSCCWICSAANYSCDNTTCVLPSCHVGLIPISGLWSGDRGSVRRAQQGSVPRKVAHPTSTAPANHHYLAVYSVLRLVLYAWTSFLLRLLASLG